VSRRNRAIAFALAALACAGLAAAAAGGYRASVEEQLGPLRPAVVALQPLAARRAITPARAARSLEVRRIPARFAPPGTLSSPRQGVGLAPAARIPAGSYVVSGFLRRPGHAAARGEAPELPADRQPVEIEVSAAGALAASASRGHLRVDVVVTSEPGARGRGRTRVEAEGVALLALAESGGGGYPGQGDTWTATLALTRAQALRLIQAENFARQVRLIPSGVG
jgi:Flp pilus assembly protein CpaB